MPMVDIGGNLADHGLVVLPEEFEQRLWLKPNHGHIKGPYAMDDARVYATLRTDGTFTARVWSEPGDPDLWYTLCTDWLPPGMETEPTEERARGYYEWPQRIWPDTGGDLGDLIDIITGIGMVYVSNTVQAGMNPVPRYQLLYNPTTNELRERVISW